MAPSQHDRKIVYRDVKNQSTNHQTSWGKYNPSSTWFNRSSLTDDSLHNSQRDIDDLVEKKQKQEQSVASKENINKIYSDFDNLLKTEMKDKL